MEYVACPPPGDLPYPGTEPTSLMSHALAARFFNAIVTWEALWIPILTQLADPRSLCGSQGWGMSERQVDLHEFMKELELTLMGTAKRKKKKTFGDLLFTVHDLGTDEQHARFTCDTHMSHSSLQSLSI